ncbi:patatin-like phospholipase family protein [Haloplasma contractile]|uniref:Lysophospholipid hydrolase protein n=1 Tax=Haloplasma contractile SSD-17B TaxID=1033810 RepID=U2EAK5_9MOLU|nr:patatin-like phospholipase family protein [Haloplasma contractile]ERJ12133.1 lysophospholipid hydrolase protein [Haloplasma contractile SSD-17B]
MVNKNKLNNETLHIGLALGGGAVLGAAHVGALKAIEDKNIKIDCIAGTSIGAIIGAFIAFGKSCEEIEEIISDLNWISVTKLTFSKEGFLTNKKLANKLYDTIGDVNFDDAIIPFSVVATDIATGERVILNKGSVVEAVLASSSIPGIFKPITIDGRMLVDGGVVENVPISPLKEMGAELIVAVSLNPSKEKPKNMIDIMLNSYYFSTFRTAQLQLEKEHLLLELDLHDYNPVYTKQVPNLIDVGYKQAKAFIEAQLFNK